MINTLFVGGKFDGAINAVEDNATTLEIAVPTHLQPVASPTEEPKPHMEVEVYDFHPMFVTENDGAKSVIGIAVVQGQTLEWALQQMVTSHVKAATDKLMEQRRSAH